MKGAQKRLGSIGCRPHLANEYLTLFYIVERLYIHIFFTTKIFVARGCVL